MNLEVGLKLLGAKNIEINAESGQLVVNAPKGSMNSDIIVFLKDNKTEILRWLEQDSTVGQGNALGGNGRLNRPRITPEMLPLIDLSQDAIDSIIERIYGGVANVQDIYPLAPLQEGILFHHLMAERGDAYLTPSLIAFNNRSRLDEFLAALQRIITRHDILRTAVLWQGLKEPLQVVQRQAALPVEILDLQPSDGDIADQLRALHAPRKFRIPVDEAPMVRCFAAADPSLGRWVLHILLHHLISDHTTLELLVEEALMIQAGYEDHLKPPVPFRNFVAQARLGMTRDQHEAFFSEMLGDIVSPTAPFGLLNTQGNGEDIHESRLMLGAILAQGIRHQARRLGVSAASLFHLGWGLVLAKTTGLADVVFGTLLFGRMQSGKAADRAMGLFINTLPLRISIENVGVEDALKRTHAKLVDLLHHEHAPLTLAQRCSGVDAHMPLFTTLLNYRYAVSLPESVNNHPSMSAAAGIELITTQERTNYPIGMSIDDWTDGFRLNAQVSEPVDSQRVCHYLRKALKGIVDALENAPQAPLSHLQILPEDERHQVLVAWNPAELAPVSAACVQEIIEMQVARVPGAEAVAFADQSLTYATLNAQANRLARYLVSLGVQPDARVAICVERHPEMVVAMIAALKAGGAFVPLDPNYPQDRLAYMVEDSQPVVVLVDSAGQAALSAIASAGPQVNIHEDVAAWRDLSADNLDTAQLGLQLHHLAYVIYTSGSAGKPKGVMIEHRNLNSLIGAQSALFGIGPGDRILQFASLSFDASVWEFVMALTAGACLCLAPRDAVMPGEALLQTLTEQRISHVTLPPSALAVCDETALPSTIKMLIVAGESVAGKVVRIWSERVTLVNAYGPTEATVCATTYTCQPTTSDTVPIGQPIANARIYVLDKQLEPVPVGVEGEIYISGDGVGRGYLNQPELTAERFLDDPFHHGARMYKTGDLGRWRTGGLLEFLGRNDFQVKIRGFRIELGEVEAQLGHYEGVGEVCVLAREDHPGDRRLVAYYIGSATPDELKAAMSQALPPHMVPAAYVQLEAFPLTPNGKIDRKQLPAPEGGSFASWTYEAPQGVIEETLATIWSDLLNIEQISRHDSFFELGGHSLLAVSLIERMREAGLYADVREIFSADSLVSLANALTLGNDLVEVPPNLIPDAPSVITPDMLPLVELNQIEIDQIAKQIPGGIANIQDIYPLAPLQEGILFHHLLVGRGDAYLLPTLLAMDSKASIDSFLVSLQKVIDRQDVLRTAIKWERLEQPVQVVLRQVDMPVHYLQLDEDCGDMVASMQQQFDSSRYQMDISHAPMVCCVVAEDRPNARWLMCILLHHIAADHTTLELLVEEALIIQAGQGDRLAAPVPFRNFVAQAHFGMTRDQHEAFFSEMLGDIVSPTAPFGLLNTQGNGEDIHESRLMLGAILAQGIRHQARRLGVSAASLFHLGWGLVLAKTTGLADVVFGTLLFGRMQSGKAADRAMGLFINTLPLRISIENVGVEGALKRTHAKLVDLLHHEHAPLTLAQRCSGVDAHMPLFTSLLNFRYTSGSTQDELSDDLLDGHNIDILSGKERTNYPIAMSVDEGLDGFQLVTQVSEPVDSQRVCHYLRKALKGIVDALENAPQAPLSHLQILPEDERHQVLVAWNPAELAPVSAACVQEIIEMQVARVPGAEAVAFADQSLTYATLNAQANRLARYLVSLGVQPDARVAICVERHPEMVVAMIAALKAGGAFVPLDPNYPQDRLAYMVEDSQPVVVLVDSAGQAALSAIASAGPQVNIHEDVAAWRDLSADNLDTAQLGLQLHHLAYVIYTSGSAGKPKGVMIEHRNLNSLIGAQSALFGIGPGDRILQFASLSFDASVWEFVMALTAGACLCLAPRDAVMPGEALLQTLTEQRISHVTLPPSALAVCDETALPSTIKMLIVAGESVAGKVVRIWSERVTLVNAYGPTEATVCATTYTCQPTTSDTVPIGQPIANARIYVLDKQLEPVPVGVEGEIYISGDGVGRGYLNQPELTAERFLDDPFHHGARMYKTGDLGRWRTGGLLEFLGRNDFQVKIRGFRIELGEVEAQLGHYEGVGEVCVLAREDHPGDRRLVAYYIGSATPDELKAAMSQTLPPHMVPAAYVQLEAFPLTPNGKIDRKQLPAPEGGSFASRTYEAPQGVIEETLATIWSDLLNIEQISRHDSFFELGGHSLLAVSLIERMRKAGFVVPMSLVFDALSLRDFAEGVIEDAICTATPSNLRLVRDVPAEAPETPPLFFIHAVDGGIEYSVRIAKQLSAEIPVYGISAHGLSDNESPLTRVSDMAIHYLHSIKQVQSNGPYRLLGWSGGGTIAYAMGHLLRERGEEIGFLGLIDTFCRPEHVINDPAKVDRLKHGSHRPDDDLQKDFLLSWLKDNLTEDAAELKAVSQLATTDEILKALFADDDTAFDVDTYKRYVAVRSATTAAILNFEPPTARWETHLFATSRSMRMCKNLGWDECGGEFLRVIETDGDHESVVKIEKHVRRLTTEINRLMSAGKEK